MERVVLLVEGDQGRNAPSIYLLREALIPYSVLMRMKTKQTSVDPDWLLYEDLNAECPDDNEYDKIRDDRCDAFYNARVKVDDKILDISKGIPQQYLVTLVVTCLPY